MDKVLKQRLTGAVILIALAVIFVPMLFNVDSPRDSDREVTLQPVPRPDRQPELRRLPLDPNAQPSAPPVTAPAPAPPAQEVPESIPEATAEPAAQIEPEPEPPLDVELELELEVEPAVEPEAPAAVLSAEPAAAPDASQPDTAEAWMVQVASFSNRDTAERIANQLRSLGHAVVLDAVTRGRGTLHRIQTGPYADRAAADTARGQIAQTVAGVSPVVRAPEAHQAVAIEPGYAVQVGSFTTRLNAERLVGTLSEAGFQAFLFEEETAGREIWRVRVGTVRERAQADALLQRLRDEANLNGLVVSHP